MKLFLNPSPALPLVFVDLNPSPALPLNNKGRETFIYYLKYFSFFTSILSIFIMWNIQIMPRIHYRSYKGITLLARDLRRNMTSSEKDLWAILRKRSFMGFKFLRQHPVFYRVDNEWIEFFVADFYCAELKLIVELDGGIHESKKEYDKERDEKLLSKGIIKPVFDRTF